jgi:hypothetical protein
MAGLRREEEMRLLDVSSTRRQRTAVAATIMKKCEENCWSERGHEQRRHQQMKGSRKLPTQSGTV